MTAQHRFRTLARSIYHRLPLSQRAKWRLREYLQPLLSALQESPDITGLSRGIAGVVKDRDTAATNDLFRDNNAEHALGKILQSLAGHAQTYGPVSHWIALPFLATGGAEMVALNLCRALRQLRPNHSVALLITDRRLVSERMVLPEGVHLVVFDDYLGGDLSYARKQALLRNLLLAARPECFHNINSEVAWHLILAEGERLKRFTQLFASIFAFQFAPDGQQKIGYAAYFLKQGLPHLTGFLSDNQRFLDDAVLEYELPSEQQARMAVLYQPCRLLHGDHREIGAKRLAQRRERLVASSAQKGRPQILWAGRLDAEKRIDLFLEVVRRCTFADFRVFGQVVLEQGAVLPTLPNLSYEGPFSSPLEWLDRFDFDAFVFTSRWEGMPNILIEVGALGIPVIAPTVGGVGELVSSQTGYPLPEQPSVDDYEAALRAVNDAPQEATARAERMLALVLTRHSWGSFLKAVERVKEYVKPQPLHVQAVSKYGGELEQAEPLVSVVIPCYNQARYLYESISSVLAACSHPLEIIVVDDGSTDGRTDRLLLEAEQMAPGVVRIHRQKNQGLSGARNTGIAMAQGQFIQLLDADDLLAPNKIDVQVAQLQVNPDLDVSVCNFLLCDESRTHFSKPEEAIARFDLTEQDFLYRWERGFAIPIHCGVFRRRAFKENPFDTHTRAKEDWLFWTSLAMAGTRFGYVHGHWAMYRQHEGSMRRSYLNMGRSWLQAGLKIDGMLAGREPIFFESVVAWFEQCYRAHPSYRQEIAAIQKNETAASLQPAVVPVISDATVDPQEILKQLEILKENKQPPLISVIIPIYGHYKYLPRCLSALAEQGDVSMEIVCIDDASPDPRIADFLNELIDKNPRLKVRIQKTNAGISATQNLAVEIACGEFIAFLDCDDELEPDALTAIRTCIEENTSVDYIFTDRTDIDEAGKPVRVAHYGGYTNIHFSSQECIRTDLLDGMVASHLKVIRRSVYKEVNGSDAEFSGVQDWELALKIAEKHRLYYLNKPLYRHRVHDGSVTRGDAVAQFRKSNIVRRRYATRWFKNPAGDSKFENKKIFSACDLPLSNDVLKTCREHGSYCIMDTRGINSNGINFIREFNSYFDVILWEDYCIPASLGGYLWDDSSLTNYADYKK